MQAQIWLLVPRGNRLQPKRLLEKAADLREWLVMPITIRFGAGEPTASAELLIKNQLPQHHLEKTEAATARELDSTLASRPFKLLLDELRAILEHEIEDSGLEIIQLAGSAGLDAKVYRPAICFVLRERAGGERMSELARERVTEIAETLREELNLS